MTHAVTSLVVLLMCLATLRPADARPPRVRITAPTGGWSTQRIIEINGTVDDAEIETVTLVVNGVPFDVRTQDGQFAQKMVMSRGETSVQAIAVNEAGEAGRDSVSVFSQVPTVDIQAFLIWNLPGQDIDLWVFEPTDEVCKWNNRQTSSGGTLHYDSRGEGPEPYTLGSAPPGNYLFRAKYYGGDEAQAQTEVWLYLILFGGTDREERRTFNTVLTKPGDVYDLAVVEIHTEGNAKLTEASGHRTDTSGD